MASASPERASPLRRRRLISLALLGLAVLLLVPGVTLPVLHLDGSIERAELARVGKDMLAQSTSVNPLVAGLGSRLIDSLDTEGTIPAYQQTRSVMGTVKELWRHGNIVVGFLILLFSVIVPLTKCALIVVSTFGRLAFRPTAQRVANAISKWSMADVFVIALIVTYLAASAEGSGQLVSFDARFGSGFFFFLGYCILSIASASLMPQAGNVAIEVE